MDGSVVIVVIVNEILVCECVTECNVVPPGVRKLNKQAVDFGFVAPYVAAVLWF